MNHPHLLLIDDHAMFRTGLRMVLGSGMKNAEVFEAGSLENALREPMPSPDLILLDIQLPGLNGVEGIGLLKRKWPAVQVLMLSSVNEPDTMRQALTRGAAGFISKADAAEKMIAAIEQILNGEVLDDKRLADEAQTVPSGKDGIDVPQILTPRQCEVLELLCQGLSNKLIARRLILSEHTVRGHVQGILRFLQVSSRSEAGFAARQRGLVA